jgi:hypothetical protein
MASGAPPAWPPGPSGAWNQALAVMAAHPKPETLPPDVYLRHDEHTLTIYDGYPKAKYHFLILREWTQWRPAAASWCRATQDAALTPRSSCSCFSHSCSTHALQVREGLHKGRRAGAAKEH